MSALIGGSVNVAVQVGSGTPLKEISNIDVATAAATAYATAGASMAGALTTNMAGAYVSEILKGQDLLGEDRKEIARKVLLTAAGTAMGYKLGGMAQGALNPVFNPISKKYVTTPGVFVTHHFEPKNILPSVAGNSVGSAVQESGGYGGNFINDKR